MPISSVVGLAANRADEKESVADKATTAEEFLKQVRQELPKHQSIKAKMTQTVSIGDHHFKIAGDYLSSGLKLRLEYKVTKNQGVEGEMLEVCDGKELSTRIQIADLPLRVTQRNIQQILAAAAAASQANVPETTLDTELGMGGLTTLLASLKRTMNFDAMKVQESDGSSTTIVQGRWKDEVRAQFQRDPKDDSLPAFVPDLVRVYVNSKTLFPEQIVYLKKMPQKSSYKALVNLEFSDVQLDVPVDEKEFVFLIPPGVIPEDVTKQYIDRFSPAAAAAVPQQPVAPQLPVAPQ